MNEEDSTHLNTDIKMGTDLVLQEVETEKETTVDMLQPEEHIENNPVVYTEVAKEDEVITVVTQENEGEIFIFERNENDPIQNENTSTIIEVCNSNKDSESISNCESKEDTSVEVTVDDVEEENGEVENDNKEIEVCEIAEEKVPENSEGKNYKNVILEDWDVEGLQVVENHESENCVETVVVEQEPQESQISETQEEIAHNDENCTIVEVTDDNEVANENKDKEKDENSIEESPKENSTTALEGEILKLMSEKKVDSLKYSKSITKNDIVKILDESTDRVVRPIVTGKDIFFSIELTKRLNQKLSLNKSLKNSETGDKNNLTNESESCNNNNTVDDRQKIVDILEADEIKDWKSVPSKSDLMSKENGNDMEISKAIKSMEEVDSTTKTPAKTPKKTPKKFRTMDKELERTLALQQLREEFPSTRKRSRTTKKVNHVPFLASTVLEKALTSPEVTTALKPGPPKRRPCYLPENVAYSKTNESVAVEGNGETSSLTPDNKIKKVKVKNDGGSAQVKAKSGGHILNVDMEGSSDSCISNPVVKTYSVKRKSTDTENNIKTTLETIAAVTKALSENAEDSIEPTPKKQKTVTKSDGKIKKKILVKKRGKLKGKPIKSLQGGEKKRNLELEKLLGDEGAVRMLYETQQGENSSAAPKKSKTKSTSGLKKDLVLKTKLVKNAVMRLSGVGSEGVFLRGKRRSIKPKPEIQVSQEAAAEPLFASTPNIVLYKPKKKQRAEASRILYRHSSSESFDSSEGYRRTSFEADGLNVKEGPKLNGEKSEESSFITAAEADKVSPKVVKPKKSEIFVRKRFKRLKNAKNSIKTKEVKAINKSKGRTERLSTDSVSTGGSKLNLSNVPVRKSSRPRMVSKKYSIWSSTSMDSLSVESLGLKKLKKASTELGKKLNCKELTILQYEHLVQVVLSPSSTLMKNSLNQEVLQELKHVFSLLSEEESCKAVLLSSTGSTFCQGIDINHIISFSESERKNGVSALTNAISEFITCLTEFKKPLIAGVHAAAIGLGVTLLPYCDLVVCSDKTSFYTPYVKLGQAPEGAPTHTFPRISRQLVSELLFKSHKMTATDALKHGLVTQIIPEERFEEELIIMSRNMAAQPTQGMQSIKFLLRSSDQEEIIEALRLEGEMLEEHWTNSECLNNMIRFLNSGEVQLKQLDNT